MHIFLNIIIEICLQKNFDVVVFYSTFSVVKSDLYVFFKV